MIRPEKWKECKWPYDKAYAAKLKANKVKCFEMKIKGGRIILIGVAPYSYVVSCGADSDRSHSGCLYGAVVYTLEAAKRKLEERSEKL
jgi:hypothetical protein